MQKIGDILFDPSTRLLHRGDEEIRLSIKAAGVLLALAETPGAVWARDALLDRVWPQVQVGEEVLTHAVRELRRAFGDDTRNPRFIATVHKTGYRLLQPVTQGEEARCDSQGAEFDLDSYATYLSALELEGLGGKRNTANAIEKYRAVIQAAPKFSLAYVRLAKALTYLDCGHQVDFDAALDCIAMAKRLRPRCPDSLAAEGFLLGLGGAFDKGLSSFNEALALNPQSAETHYLMARACLAASKLEMGAAFLTQSARLDGDAHHPLALSGKVWFMLGEHKKATDAYAMALARIERRLTTHPDDFRALAGRARCLLHLGREAEAHEAMKAVRVHPDPVHYNLACALARIGDATAALDALEEAGELGWRHKGWLDIDTDLDPLRHGERFKRIAAPMGQS